MRRTLAAALLIVVAVVARAHAAPPEATPAAPKQASIVGTWIHVKGPTDYDSVEFAAEGNEQVFRSWLHDRPASFGHWTLQGNTLTAQIDEEEKLAWSVVSVSATKLVLRRDGERAVTTYKRAKGR